MFTDIDVFKPTSWLESGIKQSNERNDGAATGHSVIKIVPNYHFWNPDRNDLKPVIGVTTSQVTIDVTSEWTKMGVPKLPIIRSMGNFANSVSDYTALAGGGELGSVWMSKQLWRKNGYLKISPKFRIVDWEGNGKPLTNALLLAKMCLPGEPDSGVTKKLKELETTIIKHADTYIQKLTSDTSKNDNANKKRSTTSNLNMVVDALKGGTSRFLTASKTVLEDMHDIITLKKAPPPVRIQIGQYFYHPDMIIKNANFTFSKEVSDLGPLFVDVILSLETRKIMSGIRDVGFVEVDKLASRVRVADVNTEVNNQNADINRPQRTGLGGR